MDRYETFRELFEARAGSDDPALIFADAAGEKVPLSYRELSGLIFARADEVRKSIPENGPGAEAVVCDHSADTVVRIFGDVIGGRSVILADPSVPEEVLRKTENAAPARQAAEGRLFFFTSGTTSRSKAVALTSRSLCASAWSGQCMLACGPGDVILSVLPLSHVFGFVCSLLWGLAYGAAAALGRGVRHMLDDTLFFRPTILPAVPSLMDGMRRFGTLNEDLRVALIGAAPCPPELVKALREKGIAVYLGYGLTETSSGIAITQDLDEPHALYPCPGADIRVEADGEVSVATPCMMEGYLEENGSGGPDPKGSASGGSRIVSPLRNGRFYTGDLGSFDEKGRLLLSGRKKDVLILPDGTKIYCPEYEASLSELLSTPEVAAIEKGGHAALVVGRSAGQAAPSAEEIARAVDVFNAEHPRSQQIYDMITTDRPLPRTATGKLRRWAVEAPSAE